VRVIKGFFSSIRKRHIETPAERMAWLLVVGTIPVGIVGLVFEHNLRTIFAKPTAAAIFLTINGLILLAGERLRRRAEVRELVVADDHHTDPGDDVGRDLDTLELKEGLFVGFLDRYFRTRTLTPFAIYCLVVGIAMIVYTTA
jgi:undecaprenyl-diphosphatase